MSGQADRQATKRCYCHFSFRRPKGSPWGIFAAAIYADYAGKVKVCVRVRKFLLWKNHQFVTAIQAYEHALRCIWEWQGKLMEHGVTDVVLVTDNSTLAGWIENPRKNREYTQFMNKAVAPYKVGGAREIMLTVGLDGARRAEKSYKYCLPELIENHNEADGTSGQTHGKWRVELGTSGKFVEDIAKELEVDGAQMPPISDLG